MQIKRIEAKTMTDALRQIKKELGPDAVILSAKDIRKENRLLGYTRSYGVEVTAAVDKPALQSPGGESSRTLRTTKVAPPTRSEVDHERRPLIHRIQDVVRIGSKSQPSKTPIGKVESHRSQEMSAIARRLESSGLSARWSERLLRAAGDPTDHRHMSDTERVAVGLKEIGVSVRPIPQRSDRPQGIAVVGPTGVGKTTAIAKIAALIKYKMKQTVGVITLDGTRFGGGEKLRFHARIFGIPMVHASLRDGLDTAIATHASSCDFLLIDTPGCGPKDNVLIDRLKKTIDETDDVFTLLAMSGTTRQRDLLTIIDAYTPLSINGALITKWDETDQSGDLIPALAKRCLPVTFFSTGSQVPLGIEEASLPKWADRLLGTSNRIDTSATTADPADQPSPPTSDTEEVYIANRSSDIYHRSDCRWIRFIHDANIVHFPSPDDAESHRFKACRYCHPKDKEASSRVETDLDSAAVSSERRRFC